MFSDRDQKAPMAEGDEVRRCPASRDQSPRTSSALPHIWLWSGNAGGFVGGCEIATEACCVEVSRRNRGLLTTRIFNSCQTFGWIFAMGSRVRHCVECPKCRTRYLAGFSPYRNGSYLVPIAKWYGEEWILYCSCGVPPHSSRWNWDELKLYVVNNQAHHRGYGGPEDIVCIGMSSRRSG